MPGNELVFASLLPLNIKKTNTIIIAPISNKTTKTAKTTPIMTIVSPGAPVKGERNVTH